MNPGSFSLFVHSLVCQITHSFLNEFQPNNNAQEVNVTALQTL